MFKYLKVNRSSQWTVNPRMDFCKDHSTLDPIQRNGQNLIRCYFHKSLLGFVSCCFKVYFIPAIIVYLLKGNLA